MWRCFSEGLTFLTEHCIFSTYVEVFLDCRRKEVQCLNFLHVCGGVSTPVLLSSLLPIFSPRMWRCFHECSSVGSHRRIFSTYVEVFLLVRIELCRRSDFLHVCGGVSKHIVHAFALTEFSPRMWRCFWEFTFARPSRVIFSTYVEVFPCPEPEPESRCDFLHVCGGVSRLIGSARRCKIFSPRMWRCFCLFVRTFLISKIFSTYVEVFPWSLSRSHPSLHFLHVCGGVSLRE